VTQSYYLKGKQMNEPLVISFFIPEIKNQKLTVLTFTNNNFAVSKHYECNIVVVSDEKLDAEIMVKSPKAACLKWQSGSKCSFVWGYLSKVQYLENKYKGYLYHLTLSSPLLSLNLQRQNQIFVGKTAAEIIKTILHQNNFKPSEYSILLASPLEKINLAIQFSETDYEFINRVMRRYGLMFYFLQNSTGPVLIVTDQFKSSHEDYRLNYTDVVGMDYESYVIQSLSQEVSNENKAGVFVANSNFPFTYVSQHIIIENHPIKKFNQRYKIIAVNYDVKQVAINSAYINTKITLIKFENEIELTLERSSKVQMFNAVIAGCGANQYPQIDSKGRYEVHFMFDQQKQRVSCPMSLLQHFGGKHGQRNYGMHFPLMPGTQVIVGFVNDDETKPVILGALANDSAPSTVNCNQQTKHILRTKSGNTLLFDDLYKQQKILLHTKGEMQRCHLNGSEANEYAEIANITGAVEIVSGNKINVNATNQIISAAKDYKCDIVNNHLVKVLDGELVLIAKNLMSLNADDSIVFKSDKNNIKINNQNMNLNSRKELSVISNKDKLNVVANRGNINFSAAKVNVSSRGKLQFGTSIVMSATGVTFANARFVAPEINIVEPVSQEVNALMGVVKSFDKVANKQHYKHLNIPDPIIFDFRNPKPNPIFFKPPTNMHLEFVSQQQTLSTKQLAYFVHHGNNATIFIHGYNVSFGKYGGKLYCDDQQRLQASVRENITLLRNQIEIEDEFPGAKINGYEISSVDVLQQQRSRQLLNGNGAHNWWLHMEWNLNKATGQFNGVNFEKYTRIINVAWNGDPMHQYDYMSDFENAEYAAEQLVAVVKQLKKAGVQTNIIAHSLGNQVLLNLMQKLGDDLVIQFGSSQKISQHHKYFNHVFMWQAAVPNNALDSPANDASICQQYKFPQAYLSANYITALYSKNDNVLGPCTDHGLEVFKKIIDNDQGVFFALTAYLIDLYDGYNPPKMLKSVYNIANIIGKPLGYFFQSETNRRQYYLKWITIHRVDGDHKFHAINLNEQVMRISQLYPKWFNALSTLIAAAANGAIQLSEELLVYVDQQRIEFPLNLVRSILKRRSVRMYINDPVGNQVAAILITIFISSKSHVHTAMGYSGVDVKSNKTISDLVNKKIIQNIDQSEWLFSHAGMKEPSDALLKQVYQKRILNAKHFKFGQYKQGDFML